MRDVKLSVSVNGIMTKLLYHSLCGYLLVRHFCQHVQHYALYLLGSYLAFGVGLLPRKARHGVELIYTWIAVLAYTYIHAV